jgi:hypothetical protein
MRSAPPHRRALEDSVFHIYMSWWDACNDLAAAYRRWSRADREDLACAHICYTAALDREETAAAAYAIGAAQLAALGAGATMRPIAQSASSADQSLARR